MFFTTSDILTVAEARANGAGAMVGEFVCNAIVETKGGAIGVGVEPCQEGGTFVAEFKIANINCWAGFGVFAAARGATGRPRMHGADWERDQVQVGTSLCRLVLTASLVASSSAVMVLKSLGYEP